VKYEEIAVPPAAADAQIDRIIFGPGLIAKAQMSEEVAPAPLDLSFLCYMPLAISHQRCACKK